MTEDSCQANSFLFFHPHRRLLTLLSSFPPLASFLIQHIFFLLPNLMSGIKIRISRVETVLAAMNSAAKPECLRFSALRLLHLFMNHQHRPHKQSGQAVLSGLLCGRLERISITGTRATFFKTGLTIKNYPRLLSGSRWIFFFFFFCQTRHPPNPGFLPASSISVQLLHGL